MAKFLVLRKESVVNDMVTNLFSEFAILRELDHPNILKINELYQDEKYYYLITEFCSGGPLFDMIRRKKRFSELQASQVMYQIISAVGYCHDRNIVHRDLKPENILYAYDSENSPIKLIDFGLSANIDPQHPFLRESLGTVSNSSS